MIDHRNIVWLVTAALSCGGSPGPMPVNHREPEPAVAAEGLVFGVQGRAAVEGDQLWFQLRLVAFNETSEAIVVPETLVFSSRPLAEAELEGDDRFSLRPDRGVVLRGEVPAGAIAHTVLTFAVPAPAGAAEVHWSLPLGSRRTDLVLFDTPGMQLVDLPAGTRQRFEKRERRTRTLELAEVPRGRSIAFGIRGLPHVSEPSCRELGPAPRSPVYGFLPADGRFASPEARPFSATDPQGKAARLADFKGKVALVHFWASWCPPCATELPALAALQDRLGSDVVVLALSSDADWAAIRRAAPPASLRILHDPPPAGGADLGAIATDYGTKAVPETYLVDRDGRLRYYFINTRDWTRPEAEACVRSLL